jgi:hypothetical protein
MLRKQLVLFAALSLGLSLTAGAGQATGTVSTVSPNTIWAGTFVQLNVPITQGYESQCPSANFAFIPSGDPVYSSVVAALMAAKASGEVVTVYTSGCVTVPGMGTQPRIFSVDYGVRMPGT